MFDWLNSSSPVRINGRTNFAENDGGQEVTRSPMREVDYDKEKINDRTRRLYQEQSRVYGDARQKIDLCLVFQAYLV